MSRFIATATLALGCALAISLNAQETTVKSKTKVSGEEAKTVTFTGCLKTGTEKQTYILDKVVPVSRTTEVTGTGGAVTTTTYMLVPGEKVEIERHVGHKVEVTGIVIPAGDIKTETKTKIDREDAKDTKIKEKAKIEDAPPHLRVVSIKHLAESCM